MRCNTPSAYFASCLFILWQFTGILSCLILPSQIMAEDKVDDPASGVVVPAGFTITTYADDDLAHDIYSMTTDSQGRIVVSGAGFIKTLIDSNNDGTAESAITFAEGPRTGAQGMYFNGNNLYFTGDNGLMRYADENGDGKADGPAQTFIKMKTGGEHTAHAIRRGPDGWWYLIAGNHTGITESYISLKSSPVKYPHAGVVMRFNPSLSAGEIFADGFRNAYDFDFGIAGDLYSYDSDGERDISLPWYRPTRVFQTLPATNHGWVGASWKEANDALTMPPVIASCGRGSPTGVVCYRHEQFPEKYHGMLFTLDWTYGHVRAIKLKNSGAVCQGEAEDFITAKGNFGFALQMSV